MKEAKKHFPTTAAVASWLAVRYNDGVSEIAPLSGGFWSSAFVYSVGADKFVLRFSDMSEGFSIDAAAMRFGSPDLPVPVVFEIGEALGFHYAISQHHTGRFIEDSSIEEANETGDGLGRLLFALRGACGGPDDGVIWYEPVASGPLNWRGWLRAGLVDDPKARVSGWRTKIASNRRAETIFKACELEIDKLLIACPERRVLVHGDLLHQNVLVSERGYVTAIFSWKCSVRGDFLFDVAWCTFWGPWHPGIAAADMWRRTLAADDLREDDLIDAPSRHHCYELQITATHMGWYTWLGDEEGLVALIDATDRILERGPLS